MYLKEWIKTSKNKSKHSYFLTLTLFIYKIIFVNILKIVEKNFERF